jgi:hypothetical protein
LVATDKPQFSLATIDPERVRSILWYTFMVHISLKIRRFGLEIQHAPRSIFTENSNIYVLLNYYIIKLLVKINPMILFCVISNATL